MLKFFEIVNKKKRKRQIVMFYGIVYTKKEKLDTIRAAEVPSTLINLSIV